MQCTHWNLIVSGFANLFLEKVFQTSLVYQLVQKARKFTGIAVFRLTLKLMSLSTIHIEDVM
jgi:hypothetical protein